LRGGGIQHSSPATEEGRNKGKTVQKVSKTEAAKKKERKKKVLQGGDIQKGKKKKSEQAPGEVPTLYFRSASRYVKAVD